MQELLSSFLSLDSPRPTSLSVLLISVSSLWALSVWITNSAIIDPYWGFGFVLVGLVQIISHLQNNSTAAATTTTWNLQQWILISSLVVWGLRLSLYLGSRFVREGISHEDYRYASFRKNDPQQYWWKSLFKVFWLQAILIWLFSQIIQSVLGHSQFEITSHLVFILGFTCWLIGFLFETIGDYQLQQFKANPKNKGKVLDRGLWKYTRHPNYFGDCMVWTGFALMALGINFSVSWYHLFLGPIAMIYLLMNVTGRPLLENHLKDARPEYIAYIERTSSFIPWFPK